MMLSHKTLHQLAHAAGMAAVKKCVPVPMVVQEHANMADDNSPIVQQWYVEGGVCGFATVHIRGNTSYGRWAKERGYARPAYPNGLSIYPPVMLGQSLQRKEAYCAAFSRVLEAHGVKAYMTSRLD